MSSHIDYTATGVVSRQETQAKMDARAAVTARIKPRAEYTIADRLEERALTYAPRPFLLYGDLTLSYAEVNTRSNRLAQGLRMD